jgi:hypothetical protein
MTVQYLRSADIGKERHDFLDKHPEIKFSAMVREAIDREMKKVN